MTVNEMALMAVFVSQLMISNIFFFLATMFYEHGLPACVIDCWGVRFGLAGS
jgi:hypothetical protein